MQFTVPHYLRSGWVVKAETNRAVMLCAASRGHTAAALLRPRLVAALAASAKVAVAGDDVDLTQMSNIGISALVDSGKTTLTELVRFYSTPAALTPSTRSKAKWCRHHLRQHGAGEAEGNHHTVCHHLHHMKGSQHQHH